MAPLIFKPLGVLAGALGGVAAGALFKWIWKVVAGVPEPPKATQRDQSWPMVLVAAAAHGAIFALVKAAIDRASATVFQKATGSWPGEPAPSAS
jgi:hypothetical protein